MLSAFLLVLIGVGIGVSIAKEYEEDEREERTKGWRNQRRHIDYFSDEYLG